jgi:anti-sigma-K factor RskA
VRNAPNANAVVVWDEKKQRGVLKVTELPRNATDRDYQLWLVDPRYKNPVDGGVFHVSNDSALRVPFQPTTPVRNAKGFAISIERKGGVPKAEGPIVLLGK